MLVNKLVPSAWFSSGALEVWRLLEEPTWIRLSSTMRERGRQLYAYILSLLFELIIAIIYNKLTLNCNYDCLKEMQSCHIYEIVIRWHREDYATITLTIFVRLDSTQLR